MREARPDTRPNNSSATLNQSRINVLPLYPDSDARVRCRRTIAIVVALVVVVVTVVTAGAYSQYISEQTPVIEGDVNVTTSPAPTEATGRG